ncbi:MAG TPA: M24 family metallopeptidase, partial [Candidatus Bacteroides intestinigallinarum]|nr:M24 family metallopeptidase [Candidatus Bacteroides intestinigallinarum]
VCHGIPDSKRILKSGDIVNVDVSTIYKGYFSDASRMFMIGEVSDNARKLVEVTRQALQAGLDALKPWGTLGDIGHAIQQVAESNGYNVVRV